MVFHCLSVPYAPTKKDISLCAFVQKVYKFCNEMTKRGHTVYHYGHKDSEVNCTEHITVTNDEILKQSYGEDLDFWKTKGFNQNTGEKAVEIFNENCKKELNKRIKSKNEFILCWFGYAHEPCVKNFYDKAIIIEPSIDYDSMFAPIKIFATYAQMHKMLGAAKKNPQLHSYFVVHAGFDMNDFKYENQKSDTALFLGRIIDAKGVRLAYEACNLMKQKINFAGPNIINMPDSEYCKFIGFIGPEKRKELLSKAKFLFAPSLFMEPTNWTAIEAQFSGTPTISTNFGGFTETVVDGVTGYRCNTFDEICKAINEVNKIKSIDCFNNALNNFTIKKHCDNYEKIFKSIINL